ncbi:TPA_asm: maturation protein [ssRNA phage SRR6960799_30]|uniref:Maturation protein n=1 Tax=ssRNA phage SRR6960799_30 TaxID=2786588 RepID=A0A8S5KZ74_9VIRU|nr:maturation protein [ssRNA phage SRR6960799_30]DAD50705.1 TPA_asm: maturation protein [ssRNA phage SRR6960799_30]
MAYTALAVFAHGITMYKVTGSGFPTVTEIEYCKIGKSIVGQSNWSGATVGDIRIASGAETPNFKKALRTGAVLPLNPYIQTEKVVSAVHSNWNLTGPRGVNCTMSSDMTATHIPHNLMVPSDKQISLWLEKAGYDPDQYCMEAAGRLATRYFDAGTFVAELRETIMSFKGLLKRFITLLTSPNLDLLFNAWLEVRYAWRPLYGDIQTFIKTVNRPRKKFPLYKERTGRSLTYSEHTKTQMGGGVYDLSVDLNVNVSARGNVYSKYAPAAFRVMPLTTAWELIPLSFIIDWFFSVGDALTRIEAYVEFPDLICSGGYYLDYSINARADNFRLSGWTGSLNCTATGHGWAKGRNPASSSPNVKFNPHLGIAELIDLLAIARQLLFKK